MSKRSPNAGSPVFQEGWDRGYAVGYAKGIAEGSRRIDEERDAAELAAAEDIMADPVFGKMLRAIFEQQLRSHRTRA